MTQTDLQTQTGLAFSTVVSLLFLPTIYTLLDDANLSLRRIIRKARERALVKFRRWRAAKANNGAKVEAAS